MSEVICGECGVATRNVGKGLCRRCYSQLPRQRARVRWIHMLARCADPSCPKYPLYGARGIRVCDRWLDFDAFYADVGDAPEGKTLDRYPDNDGNYEPGNWRWATAVEQAANRRPSPLSLRTECANGHAYTDKNTLIDRNGWRACRACARDRTSESRARRRGVVRTVVTP